MTRNHVLAGILFFTLLTAAAVALEAPIHSRDIQTLEQQYLATTNPDQRKQIVTDLKTLTATATISPDEAVTLNAALSVMLPAANSAWEAEALLTIGAATSEAQPAAEATLPADPDFLIDARRASQQSPIASGDFETLADIRIDHLRKDSQGGDGLASAHIQQVWRINNERGARIFSPRSVMYSGMDETLTVVRARVLKSNGREVSAAVSADQPVVQHGSSMYFDARSRQVRFSQLRSGDLVEIEYHLLPAAEVNPWSGYYARIDRLRDAQTARLWRRVLIAPSSMKLYTVVHNLNPAIVREQGEETTRIWEVSGTGAKARTQEAAEQPYLHVSTIGSIEELGRWYNALLEPGMQLDANLRSLADQIMETNLTTEDKVRAVYQSVQHRTRYTAFEFGVHSYQPYPVSLVAQRGFGDCKDKAAMLVALLRAVGVPAEFAMVRTRSAGAVDAEAYSVQLFDHALAYVPELNLYLDGTAEGAILGELPPNDHGAMAMTIDAEGKATRRTVPYSQPDLARFPRQEQARLERDRSDEFTPKVKIEASIIAAHP